MTFEVRGLAESRRRIRTLAQRAPKRFADGLRVWTERVMARSRNDFCPVDKGELQSTGAVQETTTKKGPSFQMMYGTEYAVPQHERGDFVHRIGQWKFLEQPMFEEAGNLEETMAEHGQIREEDLG
jgi:hypothetical protein